MLFNWILVVNVLLGKSGCFFFFPQSSGESQNTKETIISLSIKAEPFKKELALCMHCQCLHLVIIGECSIMQHVFVRHNSCLYTNVYREHSQKSLCGTLAVWNYHTGICHGGGTPHPSCPTQPGVCKLHKNIHYIVSCFFGSICAIRAWWAVTHRQVGASHAQIVITLDSPYMHCRLSYWATHWTYLYKVFGLNVSISSNISCVSSQKQMWCAFMQTIQTGIV